jgi:hypothetical protein
LCPQETIPNKGRDSPVLGVLPSKAMRQHPASGKLLYVSQSAPT